LLKDFSKLETFLIVVRERGFSKASAKLGVSQPAVTQQIKYLEQYLDTKLIERKKSGIKLTSTGEELYKIAVELENAVFNAENQILKIINKNITFNLGASFTIGNYIVPGDCMIGIKDTIGNDVNLTIEVSRVIVEKIKERALDMGLIEAPIYDEELVYRNWLEDELVLFSNTPLPRTVNIEDLYNFDWVCREPGSHTRKVIQEKFETINVSCKEFNVVSEVNSSTALLNTILRSKQNLERPMVSIISKYSIAQEVNAKRLYQSRIKGITMDRNFYIVYNRNNKSNPYIISATDYLLSGKC
jgi:DNA-binding transcriptional LysR family regulator